jgi:hypothetical protein
VMLTHRSPGLRQAPATGLAVLARTYSLWARSRSVHGSLAMQNLDCPRCRASFHTGAIYEDLEFCPRCGAPLTSPSRGRWRARFGASSNGVRRAWRLTGRRSRAPSTPSGARPTPTAMRAARLRRRDGVTYMRGGPTACVCQRGVGVAAAGSRASWRPVKRARHRRRPARACSTFRVVRPVRAAVSGRSASRLRAVRGQSALRRGIR